MKKLLCLLIIMLTLPLGMLALVDLLSHVSPDEISAVPLWAPNISWKTADTLLILNTGITVVYCSFYIAFKE